MGPFMPYLGMPPWITIPVATVAGVTGFVVDPFGRHNFETVDLAGSD